MDTLINLAKTFQAHGITAFEVGGCVRDSLLGIESNDIDICLVGATSRDQVTSILKTLSDHVKTDAGNRFPVWIIRLAGEDFEVALARQERSTGASHQDFEFNTDSITIEEDLIRRDLTINAMARDIMTGKIIDPFGGREDLENRIAREVSPAFDDDPERVIRAARFIPTFDLTPTQSLIDRCRRLQPDTIPPEAIGQQFKKAMERSVVPSKFFRFLETVGWLELIFPEVHNLIGLPQDPVWHPEGDVFEHTMHCLDEAGGLLLRTTMLCHDFGKVTTTSVNKAGRISAHGHDKEGVPITSEFLTRNVIMDTSFRKKVMMLVELHMFHARDKITDKSIRKALQKLQSVGLTFDHLVEVCRCDVSGRPPLPAHTPDIGQNRITEEFHKTATKAVVTGKVLIDQFGWKQGIQLGQELRRLRDLQDEGELTELNWEKFVRSCNP